MQITGGYTLVIASTDGVVERHLGHLRWRNLRASTITQRKNALGRIERATGVSAIAASAEDIVDWLSRDITPQTRAAEMSHLRGFFRWAIREGLRIDNPMERIDRPKLPRGLPHPIPEADLGLALEMAPERVKPMLYLAAYAGLRACEIANLHAEHLFWDHDPPIIMIRDGKGGHDGAVPMAPILEPVLRALPRKGPLFPRHDGKPGAVKPHSVSHLSNNYLHGLGITSTLHALRHRFGTMVYRHSGRDLRQAQELLRHRSPVSTAIYTAVVPGEGATTVAAIPRH